MCQISVEKINIFMLAIKAQSRLKRIKALTAEYVLYSLQFLKSFRRVQNGYICFWKGLQPRREVVLLLASRAGDLAQMKYTNPR